MVLATYGKGAFDSLPDIDEMMKDKRPLTFKAWLGV